MTIVDWKAETLPHQYVKKKKKFVESLFYEKKLIVERIIGNTIDYPDRSRGENSTF